MVHTNVPSEDIMVIKTRLLSDIQWWWRGFLPVSEKNSEKCILEGCDFMEQVHAEKNPLYKEVIPYAVIYNSLLKKVLIYEEISEQIPKNYFARMILWIKIYVKKFTWNQVNILRDTIIETLKKYLSINFAHIASIEFLGFVYDETNDQEKSKVGLFYFVETLGESEQINSEVISSAQYLTIDELEAYIDSWEIQVWYWSSLIFPFLKQKIKEVELKNKNDN